MRSIKFLAVSAMAMALSVSAWAQTFTQTDLEKMVNELAPYLGQDARLVYPVRCVVEDSAEVNAYASPYFDPKDKDAKPRANITVFTGLVKHMNGDMRLVRAVIAHELAHLSKGHIGRSFKVKDLSLILTRQQEYEADIVGAAALQKAGYTRKDMVDMLQRLGEAGAGNPASSKVLGDHADCRRRASAVDGDNLVLRSMVSFTNGEAYYDVRNYFQAMQAFDKASVEAPAFYESKYNAAQSALVNYYDRLADGVKDAWYIPDFGPSLTLPASGGKATTITESDRENYRAAQERVAKVIAFAPMKSETKEIQGLLLVLDPDGKSENLSEGVKNLEAALAGTTSEQARLRVANNLAIGYQRSGNVNKALDVMLSEARKTTYYNSFLAVNLGQQVIPDTYKNDALKAEAVIYTFLSRSSSATRGYEKAMTSYKAICAKYGFTPRKIEEKGISLARVFSVTDGQYEISLLGDAMDVVTKLGKAQNATRYSDDYVGFMELVWKSGDLSILTEMRGSGDNAILEILRVTSYTQGAYIDLKPKDTKISGVFRIKVGMTEADFGKILDPKGGVERPLIKGATIENWLYYPGLNFGILLKDGKIAGVTATPADISDLE